MKSDGIKQTRLSESVSSDQHRKSVSAAEESNTPSAYLSVYVYLSGCERAVHGLEGLLILMMVLMILRF